MAKNSAIIIGAGPLEGEVLHNALTGAVDISASDADPANGKALMREWSPTLAVLYLDHQPEAVLSLARELSGGGSYPLIVVSNQRNPDAILGAMRAGARDFAFLDAEEVRRAVVSIVQQTSDLADGDGRVISIFSSKGGSGATTIATNLAGALASESKRNRTVLMDLDFQMGDVLVFLDLGSSYSVRDLILNTHRLDEHLLRQSLTEHSGGFHVVAQTDNPEDADEINGEGISKALRLLRQHYDFVLVDGMRDFREGSLAALDMSSTILLTMTQDVPALKNANRCLSLFQRLGYGKDQVKLVINRYTKKGDLDVETIEDALQYNVHATISNDFPTVIDAINKGSLLVSSSPKAAVTRDYRSLVDLVGGFAEDEAVVSRSGIFGRLGRK